MTCSCFGISISPSATAMPSAVVPLEMSMEPCGSSRMVVWPRSWASRIVSIVSSGVLVCT